MEKLARPRHSDILATRLDTSIGRSAPPVRSFLRSTVEESDDPEERLASLESIAKAAWDAAEQNIYDWYSAIVEIRDKRLYQSKYKSFEAYLRDNWYDRISRARVWQLISMQRVIEAFSAPLETHYPELPEPSVPSQVADAGEIESVYIVDYSEIEATPTVPRPEPPKTEAQARELVSLLPEGKEVVVEVFEDAKEVTGLSQPPASAIREARKRHEVARTTPKVKAGETHGCPDCGGMFIGSHNCEWAPFEQSFELWAKRRKDRVRVLVSKYFQLSTVQQASTHSTFERRPIPKSESARKARRLRG